MAEAPENPPAFPQQVGAIHYGGMTLRDWFAGQWLSGMAAEGTAATPVEFAEEAYAIADEMLVQRAIEATSTADQSEVDRWRAAGIQNIANGKCTTCGKSDAECDCLPF